MSATSARTGPTNAEPAPLVESLARQLPQLRQLPGCPQGSDEAIMAMSLPPAYTACPNPFIEDWLKSSTPPSYDQQPYQDPGPFTTDISEGKSHPIYKAHSYHTKVPHQAIMRYLLHYTRPGDVVLDGFCGTGMTGVAAQACGKPDPEFRQKVELEMGKVQWGARRAILQDLSPAATFIAAGLNLPIDAEAFDRRSREILDEFEAEWVWMYQTTHTDGRKAKIDYTIWSEVFTCPHCGGEIIFYDAGFDETTGDVRDVFQCPGCGAQLSKDSVERRLTSVRSLAGDVRERIEFQPVRIFYSLGAAHHKKVPDDSDRALLKRIGGVNPPPFPSFSLPLDQMYHGSRLGPKGFTNVHHLYSDRSLIALASLWAAASHEENPRLRCALLFWIEQAIWGLSLMNRWRAHGYSHVNQYMTGVYYIPSLIAECSPRYNLEGSRPATGKRASLVKVWKGNPTRDGSVTISTKSSTTLELPDSVIDYVFVDPPFGANIPYADLDFLVEAWHKNFTAATEEAIIDVRRGKGLSEYRVLMEGCFRQFHRVLRSGRWMTVEFSNSSNEVWLAIQQALSAAGFIVADTRVFDKEHLSYRQVTAKNAVKRDLIISAYKPAEALEQQFSVVSGSEGGAWAFVQEHLSHLPVLQGVRGSVHMVRERQADRLYDRMVAYHVHKGVLVPVTASEFYAGLERRFPVRDDMYFLPEQVEKYERHRMTIKDLGQAELFITNESSAVQWLRQQLKRKPRAFAEIQPPFFEELQAGLAEWEDLPDLKALLEENFLQDDKSRWYVPDPNKASDLEKIRTRALLKEFTAYSQARGRLVRFRSEAIRAGFKDAWARRDFNLIVAVGNRLPTDSLAQDAALLYYYDNARRLAA